MTIESTIYFDDLSFNFQQTLEESIYTRLMSQFEKMLRAKYEYMCNDYSYNVSEEGFERYVKDYARNLAEKIKIETNIEVNL